MHIYDKLHRLYNKLIKISIIGKIITIISKTAITLGLFISLKLNLFNKFIFFYKVNNKLNFQIQQYDLFTKWLINNISCTQNVEKKCYYLHILFVEKLGTKELFKEYINAVLSLDNKLLQYRLAAYEIPWIWFLNQNLTYDNYFTDHRKLLEIVANNMHDKSLKKQVNHIHKNIAILVMSMHSKRHASARLEIYLANEFAKQGYDVSIFVADTTYLCDNEHYILEPLFSRHNNSTIFQSDHNFIKENSVNIIYNHGNTAEEMYNNYINAIYDYAPELIIDITWENAIFNPILKKDFTIISVPLGGNITAADIHGYVSRNIQDSIKINNTYKTLDNVAMIEGNIYIPYDTTIYKRFKRKLYGISDNDFVIVTVGNRLEHELSNTLIFEMSKILDDINDIKWILIGPNFPNDKSLDKYVQNKQIILWGYERELPSLYNICDCFLNPARIGGGGSVALFVQCGKPAVVTNTPSDVLPFIGIENTVDYNDDKDLINEIIKIYNNRNYGKQLASNQRKTLMRYELSPENFVKQIIKLYNTMREKYND